MLMSLSMTTDSMYFAGQDLDGVAGIRRRRYGLADGGELARTIGSHGEGGIGLGFGGAGSVSMTLTVNAGMASTAVMPVALNMSL